MSDVHVRQFDSTVCGRRNCAAASGAMAVAYGGGPVLTARQFRDLSGISCALNVDTASGGLRAVDVWRVAGSLDIAIQYGGENGALVDWPSWTLETRLREGEGCIVLGDCKVAPTSPCATDELYHSAFVHGFRINGSTKETHWHDPRLSGPSWQPISEVIRYWQGMDHGRRFAGFVEPAQVSAPPDTSTGDGDMAEIPVNGFIPETGVVEVKIDGCRAINPWSGRADTPLPKGTRKTYAGVATLGPATIPEGNVSGLAYFLGTRWVLRSNVNVEPGQVETVLPPGKYVVRG